MLSTFSRVMKEKGIEIAIEAVKEANKRIGKEAYHLIVYGQVDNELLEWFDNLVKKGKESSVWEYGGVVPFNSSTEILKDSFALLFPTYYEGEGFAGTLIDAFASGVPVIASDWRYNAEIVKDRQTGRIFKTQDTEDFTNILLWAYKHQRQWNMMKENCLAEATDYLPSEAIKPLVNVILH